MDTRATCELEQLAREFTEKCGLTWRVNGPENYKYFDGKYFVLDTNMLFPINLKHVKFRIANFARAKGVTLDVNEFEGVVRKLAIERFELYAKGEL